MAATSSPSNDVPSTQAEVEAAANYLLSHLVSLAPAGSPVYRAIHADLCSTLNNRFTGHWWAEDPEKGSAYRSITRYGRNVDPILVRTVRKHCAQVSVDRLASILSRSMSSDRWTMWIDPGCVAIRLFESGATNFDSVGSGTAKSTVNGIVEIWGKLPASLVGTSASPSTKSRSPHTPQNKLAGISPSSLPSSVTSEFLELIHNSVSPSKKSRAVAIVRPKSGHSSYHLVDDSRKAASTPPPPLPPLAFTIEESTSPYVPSFNNTPLGTAIAVKRPRSTLNLAGIDRAITPLASSPLSSAHSPLTLGGEAGSPSRIHHHSSTETISAQVAPRSPSPVATTPNANVTSDPFARPSSRSSTASVSSNASCSIFSHASNESRSSSIGSYTTMSSIVGDSTAAKQAEASMLTSLGEMTAVKGFSFPRTSGLTAPMASKSTPSSPSKTRIRASTTSRHGNTLSISSIMSATSSAPSASSESGSTARPGHSRGRSSQSNIRVSKAAAQVQDYSNGKVGVLGGGVLLGLSSGGDSKKEKKRPTSRPNSAAGRHASSSELHAGNLAAASSSGRPRSKSRTPSSSSSGSSNGTASGNTVYAHGWYAHHQQQAHYQPPMPALPAQWR